MRQRHELIGPREHVEVDIEWQTFDDGEDGQ